MVSVILFELFSLANAYFTVKKYHELFIGAFLCNQMNRIILEATISFIKSSKRFV